MTTLQEWDIRLKLNRVLADLTRIEAKLDAQYELSVKLFALITGAGVPDDLKLKVSENMTIHAKMGPKGTAKPKLAGPPIQLQTTPSSIGLVLDPIDATGADVVPTPDMVGTLTVDNTAAFVIVQGADTLHYTGTIPAGTPPSTTFTVTAGLTGTFPASPLSATQQFTTPPTPLPTDLKINVSIGP